MKKILFSLLTLVLGLVLSGSNCSGPDPIPEVSNIRNLKAPTANITAISAHITYDLDKDATVYWMVYLSTADAPDAATIQAQGAAVWKKEPVPVPKGNDWSNTITGLVANTSYTLYMVDETADGLGKVVKITFTTKM